jgi:hypothetical protein
MPRKYARLDLKPRAIGRLEERDAKPQCHCEKSDGREEGGVGQRRWDGEMVSSLGAHLANLVASITDGGELIGNGGHVHGDARVGSYIWSVELVDMHR